MEIFVSSTAQSMNKSATHQSTMKRTCAKESLFWDNESGRKCFSQVSGMIKATNWFDYIMSSD
jgi:hypothetical protein